MSDIVKDILSCTDDILSLRDDIGAIKHHVYILHRIWTGTELGSGSATDTITQILPTPYIVDCSHSLRIKEGGKVKEGDLIIKNISKQSYTEEKEIDCSVINKNEEKYYYINERLYTVISVTSGYVTWNVQVRKSAKQKTYL